MAGNLTKTLKRRVLTPHAGVLSSFVCVKVGPEKAVISYCVLDHPAITNWWYWWPHGVIPAHTEQASAPTPPSTLAATPAAPSAPLAATPAVPSVSVAATTPATTCSNAVVAEPMAGAPSAAANAAKVVQQIREDRAFALARATPLPPSPTKSEEAQNNALIAPSSLSAGLQA
ncbi:hypothetical protein B0H16DRAFT_1894925 [Mycena metata]|uniref:Uncharacterized protein n=1 Tax=Mycena metata TaxID=1033252 RepID=A0AAD7HRR0_9AGAR|nr:hypothetical protein B0H16DRAFT_1894925 [Mycena metata]